VNGRSNCAHAYKHKNGVPLTGEKCYPLLNSHVSVCPKGGEICHHGSRLSKTPSSTLRKEKKSNILKSPLVNKS